MAHNPELLTAVQEAFSRFLKLAPEFWNDSQGQNKNALCNQLHAMNVPVQDWISEHVFSAAYVQAKANGVLASPPAEKTRQELEAEWNTALRADGSRHANSHTQRNPKRNSDEDKQKAKLWLSEMLNPERAKAQRQADKAAQIVNAETEQGNLLAAIPVELPFESYSKEQVTAYKKLTAENIRKVNARHREYMRANPVEQETE